VDELKVGHRWQCHGIEKSQDGEIAFVPHEEVEREYAAVAVHLHGRTPVHSRPRRIMRIERSGEFFPTAVHGRRTASILRANT
jgi:hypothetical protein